jgi:hypothetical protein
MLPTKKYNLTTTDAVIRKALKTELECKYEQDTSVRVIEELGLEHGTVRVDLAVVNGIMHGYEIKSDLDNLSRLPDQMRIYNSIFDQVTLVVGKSHLYEAIHLVPEWWGIRIAKIDANNNITFNWIREPSNNLEKNPVSIARLLWKEEALDILQKEGLTHGLRSKSRSFLYNKLCEVLDLESLEYKVREILVTRQSWRFDEPLVLSGG